MREAIQDAIVKHIYHKFKGHKMENLKDTPIDRSTLDQLGGVMNNVQVEYGLLISWNGFKDSIAREEGNQFFKICLWNSRDVINKLFDNYGKLSPSIKAEIPLKQIWILSEEE